jgi:type IV secretion system protein VirB6
MSVCDQFVENASLGVAPALRAVDCLSGESTAAAFGRLFGGQGALGPALTIILTLYIAFFAISLMLGRSRLSISALSPRMLTLGLVLTFATSWMAYQNVVWNLATGAPDQIAGVLTGAAGGSATQIFADRVDMVFAAIADVSQAASGQQQAAAGAATTGAAAVGGAASGSFTPGNLMWLSALLLLLGTVGVLVTARIALAVLLAIGPVFVVMALFPGTRGLTAGWLRGLVMTAVTPLFVVLGGGITLELLVPVVSALGGMDGINGRAALALFLIAAVHVALMVMVMKVTGTIVAGWQVFGLAAKSEGSGPALAAAQAMPAALPVSQDAQTAMSRRSAIVAATVQPGATGSGGGSPAQPGTVRDRGVVVAQAAGSAPALPPVPNRRARGIGSRFAAPAPRGAGAMR